ncbi:MAG: VOC family protein [Bacteroidota bacterium]
MKDNTTAKIKTAIVPTLSVRNGVAAIEFYKNAFGAVELMRIASPDGLVVAEMEIDGAKFFLADESPEHGNFSPLSVGGVTIRIALFVDDPDTVADRAVAAGATVVYPVADQHYGYRLGQFSDPFGHQWEIGKKL